MRARRASQVRAGSEFFEFCESCEFYERARCVAREMWGGSIASRSSARYFFCRDFTWKNKPANLGIDSLGFPLVRVTIWALARVSAPHQLRPTIDLLGQGGEQAPRAAPGAHVKKESVCTIFFMKASIASLITYHFSAQCIGSSSAQGHRRRSGGPYILNRHHQSPPAVPIDPPTRSTFTTVAFTPSVVFSSGYGPAPGMAGSLNPSTSFRS